MRRDHSILTINQPLELRNPERDMSKKVGIKTKTVFLSLIIMSLMLVVGGLGIYAVEHLTKSIHVVSNQSLPAVRSMTLVDMMHDGVRAVVYRSLVATPSEKEEVLKEYKEFSGNISKYLSDIEKLGLDKELNESISKSRATISRFQESGLKVVETALSGDREAAMGLLPAFVTSFEQLAVDLEKIGDSIQEGAAKTSEQSQKDAEQLKTISMVVVGVGVALSALISYLAYLFIAGLTINLLQITKGLKEESQQVVSTSQNMAQVASKLSEASVEQAASLQETVASIDEISAMISRNADSASSSSKMSEQSTAMAQKGKEAAEQMMDSVNAISQGNEEIIRQMQKSNSEITEIAKVIQDIGLKTQVINDIVFQTKLLSFNASVEAARAGEHGKGFAVVAEEVGNLASMSGNAAHEITDMLTKSVKRVTEIVDGTKGLMDNLIKQSKEKVEQGAHTARQCQNTLDEILSKVSSVNEMIREISIASQEQSSGVREVNKAMSELDQVTQSNSSIAQESSKAAHGLSGQAERLNRLVEELTNIVGGKSEGEAPVYSKPLTKSPINFERPSNVVQMKKAEPKATPKIHDSAKKVVGLDVAPQKDDPRFEDV